MLNNITNLGNVNLYVQKHRALCKFHINVNFVLLDEAFLRFVRREAQGGKSIVFLSLFVCFRLQSYVQEF